MKNIYVRSFSVFKCKVCGTVFNGFDFGTVPRCPNCGGYCIKL